MKNNNNISSSANSAIRNNNAYTNREMYNKSRTGWSEGTPAFRTPDLEYFDGKMTFAKAPNGYIASILSWYDNTATYYEKIDGRWFQLSKERTEAIQSELREKGRKMVEAAKQEMEKNNISSNNDAILNEGEYIVWTFGDYGDPYNTKKEALAARKEFFGHLYASEAEMDRLIPVRKEIWARECGNVPVCAYEQRLKDIENQPENNYELVDNGQFPYGYQSLEDSRLYNDIANVMKDNLFYGSYGDDDYVVYEGENVDYTFAYTYNWASGELTYQIANDYDYCKGCTDCNDDFNMDKRLCDMMKWLEEHLLEIDRREWEKRNNK